MAKSIHDINLLPNKGEGILEQFLTWALTIGRLLIILTETLALGTFLYRFSLDMQIIDLHDKIKNDSYIVKSFASAEASYRNLQNRLVLEKKYDSAGLITPTVFSDIIEMGRGHITFRNISVSSDLIKIEAQAPTAAPLTNFVNSLKSYSKIMSVSVDNVENKTADAYIVIGVSAYLKPQSGLEPQPSPTAGTVINQELLQ